MGGFPLPMWCNQCFREIKKSHLVVRNPLRRGCKLVIPCGCPHCEYDGKWGCDSCLVLYAGKMICLSCVGVNHSWKSVSYL